MIAEASKMSRMSSVPQKRISPEEYLEMERAAETKSEYDDGVIYAMAGASEWHNLIVMGLGSFLRYHLPPQCRAYPSDMKVRLFRPTRYYYPDVTIVCGQSQFDDKVRDVLLNPLVIFEVLSDSTERRDRGRKFNGYQTIDSLQQYVLIWQDEYVVEHFRRDDDQWLYTAIRGLDATLPLPPANCEIPLREIYYQVNLSA
jgi:Uma2 family endonuclease